MQQIVIIGAGPAGLTAGLELLRRAPQQYAVTILEASSALGGISRTVVHNGNRMDIGGHRFFFEGCARQRLLGKPAAHAGRASFG